MPRLIGLSMYRLAINLRDSSVISMVVTDGIGLQPSASINSFAWNQVSVILVMIFAMVLVSERGFARVRHAII